MCTQHPYTRQEGLLATYVACMPHAWSIATVVGTEGISEGAEGGVASPHSSVNSLFFESASRCVDMQGPGEGGVIQRLEMTREGFYQLVSLTSGEDFEAELVPQAATQQSK